MTEFYLICGLFTLIVLATSACTLSENKESDKLIRDFDIVVEGKDECSIHFKVTGEDLKDVSHDDAEFKGTPQWLTAFLIY